MKILKTTYLSIGSNIGDRLQNINDAVNFIGQKIGYINKTSSVYKTESWGFKSDEFLNICLSVDTYLNPIQVLNNIIIIESILGRSRSKIKTYIARTIDIDILLFENEIIKSPKLVIPHPKMLQRKFVMVPLAEIAPNKIHPIENKTIKKCLDSCSDILLVVDHVV